MKEPIARLREVSTEIHAAQQPTTERVGAILSDLLENSETLLRRELELALFELNTKVEEAKTDLVTTTTGAAVLYAGVLAVVAACVLGLSRVMQPWISSLIVGLVVAGVGYGMLARGRKELVSDTLSSRPARTDSPLSGSRKETFQ